MKNWFESIFSRYEIDDNDKSLYEIIKQLENRITVLEEENISLTNELYRLENSLDSRIDILFNKLYL
jgi:hypothetical protein